MFNSISPLAEDFGEKVINVSIVATIVSHGEARGRGKTLEIVFVVFKHGPAARKKRGKVSEERKSSKLPLSCLTQISCVTRCHLQNKTAPAKLADLQSGAR